MSQTRHLAAILAADVVGYSRLIGADEAGTLQAFKSIRAELFEPAIATHNGRLVKTTGDGFLVEFGSVVEALRCAIEVQRGVAGRNARAATENRIEFRIGVNVGDIVVEDDDIFGDGVNIAARLERLAEPVTGDRNSHGSGVDEFRTAKLRRGSPDVGRGPGCDEDDRRLLLFSNGF
jgi:adenylate cyclase